MRYWPVRLLPLFAAAMGLFGLLLPGRPHLPLVAGLLFTSALALELHWSPASRRDPSTRGSWARASRSYGRSLAAAALVGAAVGGAILLVFTVNLGGAVDLIAQR